MSLPLFEKVLRDYSEMGGGYLSLTPVTGDIMLDKHLLDRLELIKNYPSITEIGVTTNAAMMHRFSDVEVGTIVKSFGKIQISIYGLDEDEYVSMTGRKTYQYAIDGIQRILNVDSTKVYFSFRLLKTRSPDEIIRWFHNSFKCKNAVKVNSLMMGGYSNWAVLDTSKPLPYGATWSTCNRSAQKTQCIVPLLALGVSANGDVSFCPCVGAYDDLLLGNVSDKSLREIYDSVATLRLWDWTTNGVPASCTACSHHQPIDVAREHPSVLQDGFLLGGA